MSKILVDKGSLLYQDTKEETALHIIFAVQVSNFYQVFYNALSILIPKINTLSQMYDLLKKQK